MDLYRSVRAGPERRLEELLATAEGTTVVAIVVKAATAAHPKIHYTPGAAAACD